MLLRVLLLFAVSLSLTGCVDWVFGLSYDQTDAGKLEGKLVVEWVDQDKFLFIPDKEKPLVFRRKNGEVIQPEQMFTDGGSVPQALRAVKSYSPWGYAPAFIVHDWLFVLKHCALPGHEKYNVDKAAIIMAEAMKTVMENPKYGGSNKLVHYSMYQAVRSPVAQDYWDNGKCETPTGRRDAKSMSIKTLREVAPVDGSPPPRPRFEISF